MFKPAILIAEGDTTRRQTLKEILIPHGYELIEAWDKLGVIQTVQTHCPDLVILGSCGGGDWSALEMAQEIRREDKKVPLIIIVTESSEDLAIAALRAGVNDYLKAPHSLEELPGRVNGYFSDRPHSGAPSSCSLAGGGRLIGESPAMRSIRSYIPQVATTDSTVLITGESGTGKELAADLIHKNSHRHMKPFVCVNCAALPDSLLESELFGYERGAFTGAIASQRGKFEMANSGTILLDEIGDMNLYAQAKILRTIENKEIYRLGGNRSISLNVRVIAATNQDPERLMTEKRFRGDLYYRLNVARIHMPSLRDRKEDIFHLLDHYIRELNHRFGRSVEGFTEEALACLLHYDWPGNVRELKNLCEAIFINLPTRKISFLDLPLLYQNRLRDIEALPKSEQDQLLSALFTTNWNVSKAAKKLNWSRTTIYRKLEKYHIKKPLAHEEDLTENLEQTL